MWKGLEYAARGQQSLGGPSRVKGLVDPCACCACPAAAQCRASTVFLQTAHWLLLHKQCFAAAKLNSKTSPRAQ